MSFILAPSMLAADFANLQQQAETINNSKADWFHVDVMDGVFVPNISFGFPAIKALQKHAKKPLDVHLMIVQPERYLEVFKQFNAHVLTVHYETCTHLHRTIQAIKSMGMHAGVAINPHTPISALENVIADIDLLCIMSVNPGFGGQKFIENTFSKISQAKELIKAKKSSAKIEVDGGVNMKNAPKLIHCGADVLVAGNSLFTSSDLVKEIEDFKAINNGQL